VPLQTSSGAHCDTSAPYRIPFGSRSQSRVQSRSSDLRATANLTPTARQIHHVVALTQPDGPVGRTRDRKATSPQTKKPPPGFRQARVRTSIEWRREGDSNPRDAGYTPNGFRDRPVQPLRHLSRHHRARAMDGLRRLADRQHRRRVAHHEAYLPRRWDGGERERTRAAAHRTPEPTRPQRPPDDG
jgi:hypothetical protein